MKQNYLPLTSAVTSMDIAKLKQQLGTIKVNPSKYLSVQTLGLVGIWLGVLAILEMSQGFWIPAVLVLSLLGILLIAATMMYSQIQSKLWTRYVRFDRFARANGLTFIPAVLSPAYGGMIFSIGRGRWVYDQLRSPAGKPFEIANYQYVTGSGKNSRTVDYGYLMIQLDRHLPHMVLDSRANDFRLFGMSASNLPLVFQKKQKLSLEGDFDKHFTLYAPSEYTRDALYVFTPDLMALFIDESSTFDAEIVDNQLYLYSTKPFDLLASETLKRLFTIIETVGIEAVSQSDHYVDERAGSPAEDIVAEPGRRLKSHASRLVLIFIIAYVAYEVLPPVFRFFVGK